MLHWNSNWLKKVEYKKKEKNIFYTYKDDALSNASSDFSYSETETDYYSIGNEALFMKKEAMRSSSEGYSFLGDFISGYCTYSSGDDEDEKDDFEDIQNKFKQDENEKKKWVYSSRNMRITFII